MTSGWPIPEPTVRFWNSLVAGSSALGLIALLAAALAAIVIHLTPPERERVTGHAYPIPSPRSADQGGGAERYPARRVSPAARRGCSASGGSTWCSSATRTPPRIPRGSSCAGAIRGREGTCAEALGVGRVVIEPDTLRRVDVSVMLGSDFRTAAAAASLRLIAPDPDHHIHHVGAGQARPEQGPGRVERAIGIVRREVARGIASRRPRSRARCPPSTIAPGGVGRTVAAVGAGGEQRDAGRAPSSARAAASASSWQRPPSPGDAHPASRSSRRPR